MRELPSCLAAILAMIAAASVGEARPDAIDLRKVALQGWAAPATLEIKLDTEGRLLFHPGTPFVEAPKGVVGADAYLLDPVTLHFSTVGTRTWDVETGVVHRCDDVEGLSYRRGVRVDRRGNVQVNRTTLQVVGRPVKVAVSRSGKAVAVLSVRGLKLPSWSLLPALSLDDRWIGWFYHSYFSTELEDRVSRIVPLGFGATPDLNPCWDPKDRFVIYSDSFFAQVIIVRNNLSGDLQQ